MSVLAEKRLGESSVEEAKAFAHRCRRAIVADLTVLGEASPVQVADRYDQWTVGVVAYHFRVLERLGMIQLAGTAQRRGATEHFYRLTETTS